MNDSMTDTVSELRSCRKTSSEVHNTCPNVFRDKSGRIRDRRPAILVHTPGQETSGRTFQQMLVSYPPMNRTRYILLLIVGLLLGSSASAQMTIRRDSAGFDDAHGRLREIDFEDFYSVTVDRILYRNPWGLHAMAVEDPDDQGNYPDTANVFLWLGQGATLDFPTRTRRVDLNGYANPFFLRITDFNDSTFKTALLDYPASVSVETGIKRIQFMGTDGNSEDLDINWSGGLMEVTTFDENDDTLSHTDFDELPPGHFFLLGNAQLSGSYLPDSAMFQPTDWHGVTFHEPNYGIQGTHLTSNWTWVDPDNPIGNLALEITPDATMGFIQGTEGALLILEQIQERDTLFFEVTDWAGNRDTVMETGWGRTYDTNWVPTQRYTHAHIGFSADSSLRQIRYLGGWGVEIDNYRQDTVIHDITAMVSAVLVAEMPEIEINGISHAVEQLDSAGFIDDAEGEMLRGRLAKAAASVDRGEKGEAVALLHEFRRDVLALHDADVLVDEEADGFSDEAGYVITRLGGVSAIRSARDLSAGLTLATRSEGIDGIRLDIAAPAGSMPTIRIVDLQGSVIRTIELEAGPGGYLWNMRDDAGHAVASGVYLVMLEADGRMESASVRVVR